MSYNYDVLSGNNHNISFSITQKSTSQNEEHCLKWLFLTTKQFCY